MEQQGGDMGWSTQVRTTEVFVHPPRMVEELESGAPYSLSRGL